MAGVTLGNFFSSGGKTVVGGAGGSGIDTQSLVKSLTEAKAIPATKLQDQIKINDAKTAAFGEFNSLLSKVKDAVLALRNPPGVGNAADNAFKYRIADVTSNTGIAGTDYVTVTASPGTALQSYTINNITSVAQAKKQATGDINIATADAEAVSDTPAAGQFKAGTFTLNGKDISLSAGESLNSVAAKFNAVSADTGISASIIKITTGKYQLSFSATKTGTDADFDFNNVSPAGTLIDALGVFGSVTVTPKQSATNAVFSFNGVAVTRQANVVSDLVEGISFTIKQNTNSAPATDITVGISADETIIKNSIVNFVNTYNDLKIFAAKQADLNADGTYKTTAVLHSEPLFRNTMTSISSQLSTVIAGIASGTPSKLSDIGISFIDQASTKDTPAVRNLLTVDDAKLATAISDNADAVRKIFEFDFTSDNTALRVFSRSNSLGTNSFSLNINPFATQTTDSIFITDADTAITATLPSATEFKAGTITINGQAITLADGDSLNSIVGKFEAVKATTGLSASLTTIASGEYKIVFSSTVTGTGKNFDLKSTAIDATGVFGNIAVNVEASYKATYDNGDGAVTIDVEATPVISSTTGLISSYSIKGKTGTVLDGLVLVYAATTASVSNINITQGVADKIFNIVEPTLKSDTGSLAVILNSFKDSDTRLNENISKINEQVELYRQQLLDKFAQMEQAISRVNSLLASLTANDNARNGTNN